MELFQDSKYTIYYQLTDKKKIMEIKIFNSIENPILYTRIKTDPWEDIEMHGEYVDIQLYSDENMQTNILSISVTSQSTMMGPAYYYEMTDLVHRKSLGVLCRESKSGLLGIGSLFSAINMSGSEENKELWRLMDSSGERFARISKNDIPLTQGKEGLLFTYKVRQRRNVLAKMQFSFIQDDTAKISLCELFRAITQGSPQNDQTIMVKIDVDFTADVQNRYDKRWGILVALLLGAAEVQSTWGLELAAKRRYIYGNSSV